MVNKENGSEILKRFIRYLYEYGQGKRTRNVGFVKVEQDDSECVVHIHGKGLRLKNGCKIQAYLLCGENGRNMGIFQGDVVYAGPALNFRLQYEPEDLGNPSQYDDVKGILLIAPEGRRFAATWEDEDMNADSVELRMPEENRREHENEAGSRTEEMQPTRQPTEDGTSGEFSQPLRRPMMQPPEMRSPEMQPEQRQPEMGEFMGQPARQPMADMTGEEPASEQEPFMEEPYAEDSGEVEPGREKPVSEGVETQERRAPRWRATKIQRRELTMLPRCEWRHANNNFLLHGYYNYHHLVLLDDGKMLKLGVPGIYHEKEARAAEGLGFPEFIDIRDTGLNLSPGESRDDERFGYWCRQVRRPVM